MHPLKVIVGMSGGVDSSVVALLLKEQGYQVEGLFMKNWEEDDTHAYCHAEKDILDAQAVCDYLGIILHKVNFSAEYWNHVFEHFLATYESGQTPNPDVLCNKEIKFKRCIDFALSLGADLFATGHYAQNIDHQLVKAVDNQKDQTYFIYHLTPDILKKVVFPIGHLHKKQVREIAKQHHFLNHAKKDSTGICFIGERKFKQFLAQYLPAKQGVIETIDGKPIGMHDGLMYYTLGQRQGLHIGGQREGTGKPWYVVGKAVSRNVLLVAQGHDHPALLSATLLCKQVHWIYPPIFPLYCFAKTRYRQKEQACQVIQTDLDSYTVTFDKPQWAVTPGQSVVFYQGNICLGGGVIT